MHGRGDVLSASDPLHYMKRLFPPMQVAGYGRTAPNGGPPSDELKEARVRIQVRALGAITT